MRYVAKLQYFCTSRIAKYLSICFLLVALLIAGCDEDDSGINYSNDTNPNVTSSSQDTSLYGDNGDTEIFVNPCPPAFILGAIGLAFAGWKLRRNKKL